MMYRQFVALSGFAMLLILLNHSTTFVLTIPPMLGDQASMGWQQNVLCGLQVFGILAVPIYFVVSGSFLAYAFQGISKEKHIRVRIKFIGSSLERLLWPYFIWSIIFYLVTYFFYNLKFSPLEYGKNLLVGYPYHFVPLLVFYYLTCPIILWAGKRYPTFMLATVLLYQMFLSNQLTPGLWRVVFPDWINQLRPPIIAVTMASWAIYLPLGFVYSLHKPQVVSWASKWKPVLLGIFGLLLILAILDKESIIHFPQASFFCPLAFVSLVPVIDRNSIPLVNQLEQIGKRSYGFYLIQIVLLDIVLFFVHLFIPALFAYALILAGLCFLAALFIPWELMIQMAKPPVNRVYTYFFG